MLNIYCKLRLSFGVIGGMKDLVFIHFLWGERRERGMGMGIDYKRDTFLQVSFGHTYSFLSFCPTWEEVDGVPPGKQDPFISVPHHFSNQSNERISSLPPSLSQFNQQLNCHYLRNR